MRNKLVLCPNNKVILCLIPELVRCHAEAQEAIAAADAATASACSRPNATHFAKLEQDEALLFGSAIYKLLTD